MQPPYSREAPNPKTQITNKFQRMKFRIQNKVVLVIWIGRLEFIWDLEFVTWNLK